MEYDAKTRAFLSLVESASGKMRDIVSPPLVVINGRRKQTSPSIVRITPWTAEKGCEATGAGTWFIVCSYATPIPATGGCALKDVAGVDGRYKSGVRITPDGEVWIDGKVVVPKSPVRENSCDLFAFCPAGSTEISAHQWIRPPGMDKGAQTALFMMVSLRCVDDICQKIGAGQDASVDIDTHQRGWMTTGAGKWLVMRINAVAAEKDSPVRCDATASKGSYYSSAQVTPAGRFIRDGKPVSCIECTFERGVHIVAVWPSGSTVVRIFQWSPPNASTTGGKAELKNRLDSFIRAGGRGPVVTLALKALASGTPEEIYNAYTKTTDALEPQLQNSFSGIIDMLAPSIRAALKIAEDAPVLVAGGLEVVKGPGKWVIMSARNEIDGWAVKSGHFVDSVIPLDREAVVDGVVVPLVGNAMNFIATISDSNGHVLVMTHLYADDGDDSKRAGGSKVKK